MNRTGVMGPDYGEAVAILQCPAIFLRKHLDAARRAHDAVTPLCSTRSARGARRRVWPKGSQAAEFAQVSSRVSLVG